jgi:dienelactone hydrolase
MNVKIQTLAALAVAMLAAPAAAAVKTKPIEYKQGDTVLQGFLAWDDAAKGKRPGVLVVHEWWGHNEHARNQAKRLAKAGYVGFALDMYGKGKVATHPDDAKAFMSEATKDPETVKARFDAARALLAEQPQVDAQHVAAIGYCFGGGVVLRMAEAGEPLAAVATFHGALPPPPEKGQELKVNTRILVQTGGADPMVPKERVQEFEKEMKDAGADIKVVTYPGAKHSFTNPDAAKAGMDALKYDKSVDEKSWAELLKFLKGTFKA